MLHKYLLYIIILLKGIKLESEGYITGSLEFNIQVGYPMEIHASREAFGFSRYVIGSTIRRAIAKKLAMIVLQCITTPSFVSLDMFAVVVQYLFSILLIHNNNNSLGYHPYDIMPFMPTRLYKRHVLS